MVPPVRFSWIHTHNDDISYAHMAMLESFTISQGERVVAAAFQASGAGCEGNDAQHLRFALSRDDGETWSPSVCVMWGLQAIWSPVLHFHAASQRLYLLYSESRKARTPGGDVKYIYTTDIGASWSSPVTILTHEQSGEVPKVLANRLLVLDEGKHNERWVLPFWREPFNSFLNYPAYHPLKDSPPAQTKEPPPGTLVPQSNRGSAGVLILDVHEVRDEEPGPQQWRVAGDIHEPSTWLIENTLEKLSNGWLLMLFRSGTGFMWKSVSKDRGETWGAATEIKLPNPNSKFSMCRVGTVLVVCYNHSGTKRAPLNIATSTDDGASWQHSLALEEDPNGHFAYPTVIHCGNGDLKAAYSYWGKGIRLASFPLIKPSS